MKALAFEGSNRTIVDKSHFIRFGFRKDAEESGEVWKVIQCNTAAHPTMGLAVQTKNATGQLEGEVFAIDSPFYRTADAVG
jgi:hypothetical protein